MNDATLAIVVSRLAIATLELFLVGLGVALILGAFPTVPPRWRRWIWLGVLAKPTLSLLTAFLPGVLPASRLVTGRFLSDVLFPYPGGAPALEAGGPVAWVLRGLAYLYLIGAGLLVLRIWLRAVRSHELIEDCLQKGYLIKPSALRRLDPSLTIPPRARIIATAEDAGPATMGLFRPAVIIPEAMMPWVVHHRLPTAQERIQFVQILRHELAHIERHDDWISLAAMALLSLFWFHPVAHWAYRRVRMNNELCCDQAVVDSGTDPCDYVDTLMGIVAGRRPGRGFALSILGDTSPGGVLKRRFHFLLSEYATGAAQRPVGAWLALIFVALTLPRFLSGPVFVQVKTADGTIAVVMVDEIEDDPTVIEILTPGDFSRFDAMLAKRSRTATSEGEALLIPSRSVPDDLIADVQIATPAAEAAAEQSKLVNLAGGEAHADVRGEDGTDPVVAEVEPKRTGRSRGSRPSGWSREVGPDHSGDKRPPILPPPPTP